MCSLSWRGGQQQHSEFKSSSATSFQLVAFVCEEEELCYMPEIDVNTIVSKAAPNLIESTVY